MEDKDKLNYFEAYKKEAIKQGKYENLKAHDKACTEQVDYINERKNIQLAHHMEVEIHSGRQPENKQVIIDSYEKSIDENMEVHRELVHEELGLNKEPELMKVEVEIEPESPKIQPKEKEITDDEFFSRINAQHHLYEENKELTKPKGKDKDF